MSCANPKDHCLLIDAQQFKYNTVEVLIGIGVISLALTAYQDRELAKLDAWYGLESERCKATEDYFSCAGEVNSKFDDEYYPMIYRATVFQITGGVNLFLGLFGAEILRWQGRVKLR